MARAEAAAPEEAATTSTRRQRTRERLLDAAFDLFAEEGFEAASIEAICERAGFTRGAFYSNFADKAELFITLAAREHRRRMTELRDAIAAGLPGLDPGRELDLDAIGRIVAHLLGAISDDRRWRLLRAEFDLVVMRHPEIAADYVARDQTLMDELADEIDRLAELLGRRLLIPARGLVRLLNSGYLADLRLADLCGGTPGAPTAPELAAQWLPVVAERLTEPLATPARLPD